MARIARADIESRWYDVFSSWKKADRAAAIKVLMALHPRLPDDPREKEEPEDSAVVSPEGRQAALRLQEGGK